MWMVDASRTLRLRLDDFWRRRTLWQRLLAIFVISLAFLFGGILSGIAGDCAPGEGDGQCGIGAFVGRMDGFVMGGIILVVGSAATILQWHRTKSRTGIR